MWALDGEARVPNDGAIDDVKQWFPEPGGIRVFTWVKNPRSTVAVTAASTTRPPHSWTSA